VGVVGRDQGEHGVFIGQRLLPQDQLPPAEVAVADLKEIVEEEALVVLPVGPYPGVPQQGQGAAVPGELVKAELQLFVFPAAHGAAPFPHADQQSKIHIIA
jgi:hypothetical protein